MIEVHVGLVVTAQLSWLRDMPLIKNVFAFKGSCHKLKGIFLS